MAAGTLRLSRSDFVAASYKLYNQVAFARLHC